MPLIYVSAAQQPDPASIDAHLRTASASILSQLENRESEAAELSTINRSKDSKSSSIDDSHPQNSQPPDNIDIGYEADEETSALAQSFGDKPSENSTSALYSPLRWSSFNSPTITESHLLLPHDGCVSPEDLGFPTAANAIDATGPLRNESNLLSCSGVEQANLDLQDAVTRILQQIPPQMTFLSQSPEILICRFFTFTCSIMSIFPSHEISNNPQCNPWQTLVWPLVRTGDFPMLYHALLSMACCQGSHTDVSLRAEGVKHMQTSLDILQRNDTWLHLPVEVILATCLALGFSESWVCWRPNIKSGASYVKNAKQCILHALRSGAHSRAQKRKLRFLCKTYLYVDVIARLTTADSDVSNDAFDSIALQVLGMGLEDDSERVKKQKQSSTESNSSVFSHLDPLMGSATTLFPLIGHVTNLILRVCRAPTSTPSIISNALDLKERLQAWSCDPAHSTHRLQEEANHTAEAYRLATLLHLHQSIPELLPANQSLASFSAQMGVQILNYLARVASSSGTLIVQIYPLLVGGCEVQSEDDRAWVRDRWKVMKSRMGIGNVNKAEEVMGEVWQRRDAAVVPVSSPSGSFSWYDFVFDGENPCENVGMGLEDFDFDDIFNANAAKEPGCCAFESSMFPGDDTPTSQSVLGMDGNMVEDAEYTIRGRLHWAGVMKEWGWEVLLG